MRQLQDKVKIFCEDHNLSTSAEVRLIDLVSELGELAKEILLNSDYGKKTIDLSEHIEEEVGDILFSLVALSNSFNIDMEASLDRVMKKYELRAHNGSIGSSSNE